MTILIIRHPPSFGRGINVLRTTGENVVRDFFTSVHPETGDRLFPTAESIREHVQNVLHDWSRKTEGQPFHWRFHLDGKSLYHNLSITMLCHLTLSFVCRENKGHTKTDVR